MKRLIQKQAAELTTEVLNKLFTTLVSYCDSDYTKTQKNSSTNIYGETEIEFTLSYEKTFTLDEIVKWTGLTDLQADDLKGAVEEFDRNDDIHHEAVQEADKVLKSDADNEDLEAVSVDQVDATATGTGITIKFDGLATGKPEEAPGVDDIEEFKKQRDFNDLMNQ